MLGRIVLLSLRAPHLRWIAFALAALLFSLPLPSVAQSTTEPIALPDAFTEALQQGARVRSAEAAQDAADTRASWRTSSYLPRASASASTLHSEYPLTVTSIREPGVFPPLDDTIHELSVNASWTVFDFGRGHAERQAAQTLAEAVGVQYDLARMETVEAVTTAFVRLAQLQAVEQAQQQRLAALDTQHVQITALHEEGRVADVDVLKIQEVRLEAQADLRAIGRQQQNALRALAAEMGRDEPPALDVLEIPPLPSAEDPSSTQLDGAVEQAPRVTSAAAQLSAAEAEAREATRAFFPSIELFGSEQLRSGSSWDVDSQWMAGVRLEVPLSLFGLSARRDAQRAKVREQEAALTDARQQVRVAFDELTNRIQGSADRAEATEARVEHLDETFRIESAAYAEGRLTLTDLLATEAKLAAGRSELVAAQAEFVLTRLRRSVLTGRLTPERAVQLINAQP